ncbi:MAG TPA: hypothetical protein VIQ48_04795 [Rhodanobacter sp.]
MLRLDSFLISFSPSNPAIAFLPTSAVRFRDVVVVEVAIAMLFVSHRVDMAVRSPRKLHIARGDIKKE